VVERTPTTNSSASRPFLIEGGALHQFPHTSQPPPFPSKTQILIATSGSTARPKVVLLSKDALFASALASARNLSWQKGDRWLLSIPFAHIGGLSIVLRCLEARQAVVCEALDPNRSDFSPRLDALGITLLSLVPTQLHAWIRSGSATPETLRAVLIGGSPCSLELYQAARAKDLPVLCTYGLSEMASQVATQSPADLKYSKGEFQAGRPLFGVQLRIDEHGGLHLKGPQLMLGYLGVSPEETFQDGWFATSDRAFLTEDGRLFIVGRMDNVIISGGENISPEWVESMLPPLKGVSEFCIFALADAKWGQRVVAAVVLHRADEEPAFEILLPEWFARAAACLPNYARPKEYLRLDALPRATSGKLDRLEIQRLLSDQRK
jgi:O-succinylbenzoic acid--CoA ligase